MLDSINTKVNIEIRPVKVSGARFLYIEYLPDRSVFEPGKIFV